MEVKKWKEKCGHARSDKARRKLLASLSQKGAGTKAE